MAIKRRFRNKKGKFTFEIEAETRELYNSKTGKTTKIFYKIPEKKYKKYIYILSFDYKSPRGKSHKFHTEIRFESPKEMSNSEIWDYIISREDEFGPVLGACGMKVKGVEIEEADYEPETSYEILSWKH